MWKMCYEDLEDVIKAENEELVKLKKKRKFWSVLRNESIDCKSALGLVVIMWRTRESIRFLLFLLKPIDLWNSPRKYIHVLTELTPG